MTATVTRCSNMELFLRIEYGRIHSHDAQQ
jgi:hypothetical protein